MVHQCIQKGVVERKLCNLCNSSWEKSKDVVYWLGMLTTRIIDHYCPHLFSHLHCETPPEIGWGAIRGTAGVDPPPKCRIIYDNDATAVQ